MKSSRPVSDTAQTTAGISRRSVVMSAAWSVPVVAAATAVPLVSATTAPPREFTVQSNFGVGWYPTTQGQTGNGGLQYDSAYNDKYFNVLGTEVGDVLTDIYVDVLISTNWSPLPVFGSLAGSNPAWTTLASTGDTTTVDGRTYAIYRTRYTLPVQGTASVTQIPIGFYFRASTPFRSGSKVQSRRYVTVNSTPVSVIRNPADVINTNVPLSRAPRP